ncbi:PEBP-like protein [Daldinia caldariorum]|uniref:PEBP-like protein n=1 Tax=Daldinia caldariorum TaxID=326644 RepID=UPI0020077431|nr:PEBP-like protein [Daldinia caldariorum]KAI1464255.1 PEBP-like protein [Daldinia caldariorum]
MSLADHVAALRSSLSSANLVPGPASALIPADFAPTTPLAVSFGDKAVTLGTFFRAGECKQAPRISFLPEEAEKAASSASYLFMLTDPDAPTPDDPKFAFWRHYVVGGLKPEGKGGEAKTLTEYLGPGPKDDSKPHRYLFLLYREPAGLSLAKEDVGGEEFVQRRFFKPAEFAEKHGLKLVGVNWMTCAGDGWVA